MVLLMMVAGCSSNTPSDEGTTPAGDETAKVEVPTSDVYRGETNGQTYPIADGITLTYWYPMAGSIGTLSDYNDSEFFQWMEKKTGIHIDFIVPAYGEEATAFNQLFIANDLPDIMYTIPSSQNYRDGMDAAIEDGYIVDLSQYLDIMPNYVSWINSIETAPKDVFTDSGKMYGFWGFWDNDYLEGTYADQGISIRKDFLDKVGLDVPTTYDEWEVVLAAFKDQLGIEAPLFTGKYGIDPYGCFMAGYGVAPYFYQENGVVKYGPMQDAYKEYLEMLHKWYENGWIDQDFSTRQMGGVMADNDMMLNDKVGALIDFGTRMTDAYISRGATNPEFYTVAAPDPKKSADSPDPAWREVGVNFHDMHGTCVLISAKSDHIEEAIKWVDSFYAKDVYDNANYGIDSEEGVVWYKAEDGHRIGDYDFRYHNPDGLDSGTVAAKYWAKNPPVRVEAAQPEQMPAERADAYRVWSTYEPTMYIPVTLTMTVDETSEYAQYYADILTYVQENNVKFITGERSLDEYDSYRDTLKSMGIEKCIALQQAALDRYNAR